MVSECPAILFYHYPFHDMEAALYGVHLLLQGGPEWDHRPTMFLAWGEPTESDTEVRKGQPSGKERPGATA